MGCALRDFVNSRPPTGAQENLAHEIQAIRQTGNGEIALNRRPGGLIPLQGPIETIASVRSLVIGHNNSPAGMTVVS
jgi:hypothetical protein